MFACLAAWLCCCFRGRRGRGGGGYEEIDEDVGETERLIEDNDDNQDDGNQDPPDASLPISENLPRFEPWAVLQYWREQDELRPAQREVNPVSPTDILEYVPKPNQVEADHQLELVVEELPQPVLPVPAGVSLSPSTSNETFSPVSQTLEESYSELKPVDQTMMMQTAAKSEKREPPKLGDYLLEMALKHELPMTEDSPALTLIMMQEDELPVPLFPSPSMELIPMSYTSSSEDTSSEDRKSEEEEEETGGDPGSPFLWTSVFFSDTPVKQDAYYVLSGLPFFFPFEEDLITTYTTFNVPEIDRIPDDPHYRQVLPFSLTLSMFDQRNPIPVFPRLGEILTRYTLFAIIYNQVGSVKKQEEAVREL